MTILARFSAEPSPPGERTLTVSPGGNGAGTVSSTPPGISCGVDCTEAFPRGSAVVLSAVTSEGSVFAGWSGAGCAGTGRCRVTLTDRV